MAAITAITRGSPNGSAGACWPSIVGRPGHLGEGGHIRSGPGIGCLRVAQTLVGRIANRPKGFPVLGGDPPADAEVAGVADDRLGAQRPMLLEVLLDPAGLVVAADLRIDAFGDDLGAPACPGWRG